MVLLLERDAELPSSSNALPAAVQTMAARPRQRTAGADSVASQLHRYSIASTSATLVTCPCDGTDDEGGSLSGTGCKAHGAQPQQESDQALTHRAKHISTYSVPREDLAVDFQPGSEDTGEGTEEAEDRADSDTAPSINSSAMERRYRGMSEEEEDALDRLIRLSSALLSVSKSILGNAKRLSVSESAWSQVCGIQRSSFP